MHPDHIPTLSVSPSGDHLLEDGRPWFYLADTIWSAFTHVPLEDWEVYLAKRRAQGFNALQISVLPVLHDMSEAGDLPEPFPGFWEGKPRFGALSEPYAEAAAVKVGMAREQGFTPVLVDVWCNYAPATWVSPDRPEFIIPDGALDEYLESVAERFRAYAPIHIVSGDADFAQAESIDFYGRALRRIKQLAPESLTGLHLQPEAVLPPVLADAPELDLYVYQSGHHVELEQLAYRLAESYLARPVERPIINIEPCYDGHGHGFRYGRFDARDVRRASWQSIVSGASAGLAYGAHGVWQWHARGAGFNHAEFSGRPFDRWTALELSGARDAAFARHLVEELDLYGMAPAQSLLRDAPEQVRAGVSADGSRIVVYIPYSIDIELAIDDATDVVRWNLETRDVESVPASGDPLVVPMSDWIGDSLVVVERGGAA